MSPRGWLWLWLRLRLRLRLQTRTQDSVRSVHAWLEAWGLKLQGWSYFTCMCVCKEEAEASGDKPLHVHAHAMYACMYVCIYTHVKQEAEASGEKPARKLRRCLTVTSEQLSGSRSCSLMLVLFCQPQSRCLFRQPAVLIMHECMYVCMYVCVCMCVVSPCSGVPVCIT